MQFSLRSWDWSTRRVSRLARKTKLAQGKADSLDPCQCISMMIYLWNENWTTFDLGTTSFGRPSLSLGSIIGATKKHGNLITLSSCSTIVPQLHQTTVAPRNTYRKVSLLTMSSGNSNQPSLCSCYDVVQNSPDRRPVNLSSWPTLIETSGSSTIMKPHPPFSGLSQTVQS